MVEDSNDFDRDIESTSAKFDKRIAKLGELFKSCTSEIYGRVARVEMFVRDKFTAESGGSKSSDD